MFRLKRRLYAVLTAVICISCALCVSCAGGEKAEPAVTKAVTQAFTPPPFDEAAVEGAPSELDEALEYGRLDLKDGFVVSMCGSPVMGEDGAADVYFTSDENNTVWVRLLILSEDGKELGSTGILKPGEYVRAVRLSDAAEVGAKITYKIVSYEPDTYYSRGTAMVGVTLRR